MSRERILTGHLGLSRELVLKGDAVPARPAQVQVRRAAPWLHAAWGSTCPELAVMLPGRQRGDGHRPWPGFEDLLCECLLPERIQSQFGG